ncbi:M67 family metallopeptidase [Nitrosopumilus sp. K4]|uniref:Mov34/MPN/PAD-1 family protein n=1 Tax=Nitrosopumilus sp. K4 TaxID=2795383 RepID=UPI001BADD148|nr:M67 family metallopeptidase [Nitrosopumilus sp. K4]QUC65045.1 M67 family metallopeptidase [Nitrosopumilus sp. K4]
MEKIFLSESQKQFLSNHAENEKPNESCAILFGKIEGESSIVKEVFLAKNIEESPVNFTISNEQLIEGYKAAEQKKMDVVGIFHSHPKSISYPSNTDKKFMQSNPVVWIIYSGISKEFKAFVLDSEIIEIPIEFL